jgi:hypothetical protein
MNTQYCLLNIDTSVVSGVESYYKGKGWLPLVPARLSHLTVLSLRGCKRVRDDYVTEILAAVPELVFINRRVEIVGGLPNKGLEAVNRVAGSSFFIDHYGMLGSL